MAANSFVFIHHKTVMDENKELNAQRGLKSLRWATDELFGFGLGVPDVSQARLAIAGSIPIASLVSQGFTDVDVMGSTDGGDGVDVSGVGCDG